MLARQTGSSHHLGFYFAATSFASPSQSTFLVAQWNTTLDKCAGTWFVLS